MIFAKKAKYPMGILWVWYGYPMVRPVCEPNAGPILLLRGIEVARNATLLGGHS